MKTIYFDTLPAIEQLFRPKTIDEAVHLLQEYGNDARILAGGTDLIVLMRDRALMPKYLISITNIKELGYMAHEGDMLRIGALATLRSVELSGVVKTQYPHLHEALSKMAMIQVRNRGTVVGNICRASPAADTVPPLLTLKATVRIVSSRGARVIPLEKFFIGPGQSCLDSQEMITEIQIPKLPAGSGTSFLRASRTAVDLAKVNVASMLIVEEGICREARVVLGGVAPTPITAVKAGSVLKGKKLDQKLIDNAARAAMEEIKPITDLRSTKEYRKEVSGVLVRRAINKAWERAENNLEA